MDLTGKIRKNIASLAPYSCARNEFSGEASVWLDANENPFNAPYNRYPDPLQLSLKQRVSAIKGVPAECIFFGNGSDESIDLAFRIFCEPGRDNVVAMDPTYGMYQVSADINNVEYRKVPLGDGFSVSYKALLDRADEHTKLIFVCSPNNPTGNALPQSEIIALLEGFEQGMVIVDEAYIDFSSEPSVLPLLGKYDNLLVFQTFSKAWGCAGLRLGMAFANPQVIDVYNKVKYPYNINCLTQKAALELLENPSRVREWVKIMLEQRERLREGLAQLPIVREIYPSDANFLLVRVDDADGAYKYLMQNGIIVRNRNRVALCAGCLRITVGTPEENDTLIDALKQLSPKV